jgi:propionate catabolism operon transcriptional regulator
MARFGGNREAAAKHLGISRTTLWRKLKQRN